MVDVEEYLLILLKDFNEFVKEGVVLIMVKVGVFFCNKGFRVDDRG